MNENTTTHTSATALEQILELSRNSNFSEDFILAVEPYVAYLQQHFHFDGTPKEIVIQYVILALAIEEDGTITKRDVAQHADITNISMLGYAYLMEKMRSINVLRHSGTHHHGEMIIGYSVTPDCQKTVMDNSQFTPCDYSKWNSMQVLSQINRWLSITDNNSDYYDMMLENISYLLDKTQHLDLSQQLLNLGVDSHRRVFFLTAACFQIIRGARFIGSRQYADIMEECVNFCSICEDIDNGTDPLVTLNLLENDTTDGIIDRGDYRLTQNALTTVLKDCSYNILSRQRNRSGKQNSMIAPEDITPKTLYYNDRECEQVSRLRDMLQHERYQEVEQRLKESGLRTGFCILLYGNKPGTGKTETVLQLCRQTSHPIMQVRMSDIRSKWVGDSEKNVQAIFDRYKTLVADSRKQGTPLPVLLLNEADALMGSRRTSEDMSSVDKMENTMQNIILQNMEDLDGIMIATTNLTKNLDRAMARRWIMTIHFDAPSQQARASIFRSMLPELDEQQSMLLAGEFSTFAGGQIENVTRRFKLESALYGTPFDLETLRRICREEGIDTEGPRSIGFN